MRRLTLTTLMAVSLILIMAAVASGDDYVEGEVLVKCITTIAILDPGPPPITNNEELNAVIEELAVYEIPEIYDFLPTEPVDDPNGKWDWDNWQDMMDEYEYDTYYNFKYATDIDPIAAAELFEACEIVEFAEPNYLCELENTYPNDDYFEQQWNFHNTGQTGGTLDADIDAPEAWDEWPLHPMRKAVVAVVDTGVNFNHGDLAANLVPGCNFVNAGEPPMDTDGHGTHIAGIITAHTNNNKGVAGTAWNWVRVMPIKVADGTSWKQETFGRGILWAALHGADVENFSWKFHTLSGGDPLFIHKAVQGAFNLGVVMCASKGNHAEYNGPGNKHFPSDYKEVIAVTATDHNDDVWYEYEGMGSNYGPDTECAAPGVNILSTFLGQVYVSWTGTSMAAPHASAICALIQGHFPYAIDPPSARVGEVRSILHANCDDVNHWAFPGWDEWIGWGRVNLKKVIDDITDFDKTAGPSKPVPGLGATDAISCGAGYSSIPEVFRIYQNYPNPAAGTTSFKFDLPGRVGGTRVTLEVYDLSGRRVATVLDENLAPGRYERRWDCSSESGQKLPAGV
jgi:hypothetical protein